MKCIEYYWLNRKEKAAIDQTWWKAGCSISLPSPNENGLAAISVSFWWTHFIADGPIRCELSTDLKKTVLEPSFWSFWSPKRIRELRMAGRQLSPATYWQRAGLVTKTFFFWLFTTYDHCKICRELNPSQSGEGSVSSGRIYLFIYKKSKLQSVQTWQRGSCTADASSFLLMSNSFLLWTFPSPGVSSAR